MPDWRVPATAFRGRAVGLVLLLAALGVPAAVAGGETTVLLVRHAEKLLTGGDVDLSDAGMQRAHDLVAAVRGAGLEVAIASKYKRAQQTIAPAVTELDLSTLEISEAEDVAAEVLENQRGRTILVAGHSNTVPQIVEALGAPSLCPPFEIDEAHGCMIPDPEYDHLFVVRVPTEGPATVLRVRYGAESP